ncbi:YacL family protein [Aliagarivorans marinus]|uniref:YacL family protein n=1 Tax=Aliagarivorans marinus TaxID=561965 RepID=UPI000414EDE9|nr:YacL family protein [Aliagarivorans marinus]
MELSIQRTLDGALLVDCGDEHRGFSQWLEHELQHSPAYVGEFLSQLKALQLGEQLSVQRAEYLIVADLDEASIQTAPIEGEQLQHLALNEGLYQNSYDCACGYEDMVQLLESVQSFIN